jgi:hypothetical protein
VAKMKRIFVIILLLLTAVYLFGQDKEQVVSFLYENDVQSTKFNYDIIFIEEFNFGIPCGKNWLVEWYKDYSDTGKRSLQGRYLKNISIYVVDVDGGEIKFDGSVLITQDKTSDTVLLSYYHSLPGITIDGICQVGDFNGDGFYDVLSLLGSRLIISGISWFDEIRAYCDINYVLEGDGSGKPPVEFINYNGENGFKLYYEAIEVWSGSEPYQNPDNHKWLFYTWYEAERKFVNRGAVEEYKNSQPVIEIENQTETVTETDAEKSPMPLWVWIAIIGGVAAVAVFTVLFAVKRKK